MRGVIEHQPIVIAGMFLSGVERAGRFLDALGVDLDPAASGSVSKIGALHDRVLERAMAPSEPGVRPWGWTEGEQLDAAALEEAAAAARAYASERGGAGRGPWGFAEPRAALLLELWARALPGAVFVLPYRAPWDVVADALATGPPELADRPDFAARAWLRYARATSEFARRHRARCVVVDGDAIHDAPDAFASALAALLGASLPALADATAVARAARAAGAPPPAPLEPDGALAGVLRAAAHDVPAAYEDLRRLAGLASGPRATRPADPEAQAVRRIAAWLAVGPRTAPAAQPPQPASLAPPGDPVEHWFREHYGDAADKTLAFLAEGGVFLEGRDVADIGSGDGIIDLALVHRGRPRRLVGYDLVCTNREHLAKAAARYGVATRLPPELVFEASQTVGIPVDDDAFDVVLTWSAFEHISDPVGVLREVRRILRPGGALFLQLWPFYRSDRGSHLWDWFPEPHHHLLEHEDDLVERMLASDVHEPDWTTYMVEEFRRLNRVTLEELHRSLLAAGFRVARLELITNVVQIPAALARYPLADLAVGGVVLLAI